MVKIRPELRDSTILLAGTRRPEEIRWIRGLHRVSRHLLIPGLVLTLSLPLIFVMAHGLILGGSDSWDHILSTRLSEYTLTTLLVLFLSGMMILLTALPAAWLVSRTDFPGRHVFEWALILPLAMPGYVMAYAWGDLAGISGPIQTCLRDSFSLTAREIWFPDLFTPAGLAFIFATTLYPYLYITARAAFLSQSQNQYDAARSLKAGHWQVFWRVGLPGAGPAILAGLTLAMMEAASDYGAADFLGVQTLGVGIVRAWSSFGEPASAARLALILIALAASLLLVSRYFLGKKSGADSAYGKRHPVRLHLSAGSACLVWAFLSALLLISFILPVSRLCWLLFEQGAGTRPIWPLIQNTLILGSLGAGLALAAALMAAINRSSPTLLRLTLLSGYATPGAVLGLGALLMLSTRSVPLSGAVALGLLCLVYMSRFTYAGLEPLLNRQRQVSAHLDAVARSLGSTGLHKLVHLDLPVLRPGLLAAGLILFVEILKELPATLLLRPFGWDTLAVRAHAYATDERLAEATLPSLLIVLAGLLPVILFSARLSAPLSDPER